MRVLDINTQCYLNNEKTSILFKAKHHLDSLENLSWFKFAVNAQKWTWWREVQLVVCPVLLRVVTFPSCYCTQTSGGPKEIYRSVNVRPGNRNQLEKFLESHGVL